MEELEIPVHNEVKSPWLQLLILVMAEAGPGMLLYSFMIISGQYLFGSDAGIIERLGDGMSRNDTLFLRYLIFSEQISFFILPSLIFLKFVSPVMIRNSGIFRKPERLELFLVLVLTFSVFPLTGLAGRINEAIRFPESMHWLTSWIESKEDSAEKMIETVTGSGEALIISLILVGIMPALGEELIFRGVIQRVFSRLFRSGHAGVWFTAILFSAVHLQFMGFLPRLILGLVFGYLFYFSGKLWLPVAAHFINNSVSLLVGFFSAGNTDTAVNVNLILSIPGAVLSAFLVILIFSWFRRRQSEAPLQEFV